MRALLRSELVKISTTRTAFGLVAGAVSVMVLTAMSTMLSGTGAALEQPLRFHPLYTIAAVNLGAFALISGIKVFTDEFRYGSIVPTLLLAPRRPSVLAAKAVVGGAFGALLTIVAMAVALALAWGIATTRSVTLGWDGTDAAALAGLVGAGALWGVLGVGLGALIRHQVAAIVGGLVWVLVIENLGSVFLGAAARFLPGQAAWALGQAGFDHALPPGGGGLLLILYCVVISAAALVSLERRDVVAA